MKLAGIIAILSVIGLFLLGETWLIQHKNDPVVHIQNSYSKDIPTSPDNNGNPVHPKVHLEQSMPGEDDLPKVGDQVQTVGKLSNGATAAIDITSGDYDPKTHMSTFILIEGLGAPAVDQDGNKMDTVIQKVTIDCVNHKIRILNVTATDGDKIVSHVVVPERWVAIPQVTPETKQLSLMGAVEHLTCPDPALLKAPPKESKGTSANL